MLRKKSSKYQELVHLASKQLTKEAAGLLQELLDDLENVETVLATVLNIVNEAVTIIDDQDQVVGWSKKAQEMYNIKPEEILGKNIKDFFSSLVVTEVLNSDEEVRDSYHQPCKGKHVLINASPIKLGGRNIGSVGAERDITETVYLHNELSKANSSQRLLTDNRTKNDLQADAFIKIYGQSKKLRSLVTLAKKVAKTEAPILICGEHGTDQELFAEAIHEASIRREKPFVVVNCGAIPESLVEGELFGFEKGAMVGFSEKGKSGKFELAHQGTIFLDEIESLPLAMQVKLLRTLQTKSIFHFGGEEPIKTDVRVIASTTKDLKEEIAKGNFREDLYYALNVISVNIPPLRERRDDIPELVYLLVQEFARYHGREIDKVSEELMEYFLKYPWPGNIRELRNVVERLVILAEKAILTAEDLPEDFFNYQQGINEITVEHEKASLNEVTLQTEKQLILATLAAAKGNKSKAAKILGIPRSTLYYKLKALGLE